MTPSEYIDFERAEKARKQKESEEWYYPISKGNKKLKNILEEMEDFSLKPEDVTLIIRLAENPKYDIGLFGGATPLGTHDCVHIVLGRGLLLKDEAFVLGFTMGSSKKISRWRRNLFMFICKYFYPEGYSFGEEERFVFNLGLMAGSKCPIDVSKVDFESFLDLPVSKIRFKLGIDKELLKNCYGVENKCFKSKESQRLL